MWAALINERYCHQASRRKLAPAQKYYTPAELLMESIRASSTKETLRKTERMTEVAASSLSRAILEPEFPEECERNKKGKLESVREGMCDM